MSSEIYVDVGRPTNEHLPSVVHVVLEDVRASDGIRVRYDFDRDGWVIEQPKFEMRDTGPNTAEEITHWHEVYFAQSWALEGD